VVQKQQKIGRKKQDMARRQFVKLGFKPFSRETPIQPRLDKLFQRVWPRIMIGVIFVLEVVWIVFLVHSSIKFIRLYF
jgi:hypothetical protein